MRRKENGENMINKKMSKEKRRKGSWKRNKDKEEQKRK